MRSRDRNDPRDGFDPGESTGPQVVSRVTIFMFSAFGCALACGTDSRGEGPVDAGRFVSADAFVEARDEGSSGPNEGGVAESSVVDQVAMAEGGGPDAAASSKAGAEGGPSADAATDGVAVLAVDGSLLCGPCSQGQQCDPTLGCVDCTMDSQCPASTRVCVLGSCVQCRTNSDCGHGTTPSCWPGDHTCHPACTTDQQCQDNAPKCDTTTGACVGCATAADCPTSQGVCDPTTQQCVQCASNADCSGTSTPACVRSHCVRCANNADCMGATPYCATGGDSAWTCVQCIQNSQCPATAPSCNGGMCGEP
jgi:hypothetical protein